MTVIDDGSACNYSRTTGVILERRQTPFNKIKLSRAFLSDYNWLHIFVQKHFYKSEKVMHKTR